MAIKFALFLLGIVKSKESTVSSNEKYYHMGY
jgi:hypothetical protein